MYGKKDAGLGESRTKTPDRNYAKSSTGDASEFVDSKPPVTTVNFWTSPVSQSVLLPIPSSKSVPS